jgi:hypothetical protein
MQHSAARVAGCSWQAIAKAEAVRGNAARLAGTPTPCLCKMSRQDGVAAPILFVLSDSDTGSVPALLLPRAEAEARQGLRPRISLILIALYLLEERVDAVLARPLVREDAREHPAQSRAGVPWARTVGERPGEPAGVSQQRDQGLDRDLADDLAQEARVDRRGQPGAYRVIDRTRDRRAVR